MRTIPGSFRYLTRGIVRDSRLETLSIDEHFVWAAISRQFIRVGGFRRYVRVRAHFDIRIWAAPPQHLGNGEEMATILNLVGNGFSGPGDVDGPYFAMLDLDQGREGDIGLRDQYAGMSVVMSGVSISGF